MSRSKWMTGLLVTFAVTMSMTVAAETSVAASGSGTDLETVDAERVHHAALARGIETMPLSAYYIGEGPRPNALLLGFGAVPPAALRAGVSRLARVIEALMREG
jgi:DNA-binding transcriptional MocR family regulator